jgi:RNA polymerase-binding protein DksA
VARTSSSSKATKKTSGTPTAKAAGKKARTSAKKTAGEATEAAKKPLKPRKSPLTPAQLKMFREMLLTKRRSLIGDMSGMEDEALGHGRVEGSGDLSSVPDHPANIASDNYEQEFMLGLLESERSLLNEINDALERIADKTYGLCQGTGRPISLARLKARPWSRYCIEYARKIEKGLVRSAQPELSRQLPQQPQEEDEQEPEEDIE